MTIVEQYQLWLNESNARKYGDDKDTRSFAHLSTRGEPNKTNDPIKRNPLHDRGFHFEKGSTRVAFTHDGSKEARAAAEAHFHGFKQEFSYDNTGNTFTRAQEKSRGLHFPSSPGVTKTTRVGDNGTHYHYAKKVDK